jgi:glycosyltransferase involved in cell wall biosynthesis
VTGQQPGAAGDLSGLRIAVVNWRDPWHPQAGGAEAYAWEMARGLLRRGARLTYLTARAAGQSPAEQRDGIQIVRRGSTFTVYPLVFGWLAVRRRRFDAVIDCQNGIPFFTPWAVPRRVPVFCIMHHVHDDQFGAHFPPAVAAVGRWLEGPVAKLAYRRHQCVAVSHSTALAMSQRLGWTGPVHIIHNGLSPAASARPGLPAAPAPGGQAALTWVGRIVVHKRAGKLLDLADRLGPSVLIDVIGRGPGSEQLAAEIGRRGLTGRVRLRGYLPEEAKRAAVAGSLLHLSTSQGEGWGLSVLEAAALGVPTVAFDVDGLRDAVRHGETGWLAGPGQNFEDVVEQARHELAEPGRRAEIARACRAWAAQFDWDLSAGQLAGLIAAATGRPAAEQPGAAAAGVGSVRA